MIYHLNTSYAGGAAIASRSLNQALVKSGRQSQWITLQRKSLQLAKNETAIMLGTKDRISMKIVTAANLALGDPFFSLWSRPEKSRVLEGFNSETSVIHIHNFYNFINLDALEHLLSLNKRVVITLHDQRLYTGGCHLTMSCSNFTEGCQNCPRIPKLLQTKMQRLSDFAEKIRPFADGLVIIGPSRWILDEFDKTNLSELCPTFHIPNVLDTSASLDFRKRFLNNEILVGFPSSYSDYMKGGDIAYKLHQSLEAKQSSFRIVTPRDFNFQMDLFWNSVDCCFLPTRMDNAPNVLVEAHLRGIPFLASSVGGVPEMVHENYDLMFDHPVSQVSDIERNLVQLGEIYSEDEARKISNNAIMIIEKALMAHQEIYDSVR